MQRHCDRSALGRDKLLNKGAKDRGLRKRGRSWAAGGPVHLRRKLSALTRAGLSPRVLGGTMRNVCETACSRLSNAAAAVATQKPEVETLEDGRE